jgi:hypothetical protein
LRVHFDTPILSATPVLRAANRSAREDEDYLLMHTLMIFIPFSASA